eukprot:TRINITY_DN23071_c0_g1_i2.p1 TRINITY_DN23071_c0_g1~~TRINITY_DN23071_c0_g1_i2.p1  ORF type:complete len:240 (-),score=31.58 TRINITY_DN23071_c0_g1_i2:150-869(-)
MCIRDSINAEYMGNTQQAIPLTYTIQQQPQQQYYSYVASPNVYMVQTVQSSSINKKEPKAQIQMPIKNEAIMYKEQAVDSKQKSTTTNAEQQKKFIVSSAVKPMQNVLYTSQTIPQPKLSSSQIIYTSKPLQLSNTFMNQQPKAMTTSRLVNLYPNGTAQLQGTPLQQSVGIPQFQSLRQSIMQQSKSCINPWQKQNQILSKSQQAFLMRSKQLTQPQEQNKFNKLTSDFRNFLNDMFK